MDKDYIKMITQPDEDNNIIPLNVYLGTEMLDDINNLITLISNNTDLHISRNDIIKTAIKNFMSEINHSEIINKFNENNKEIK